MPVMIVRDYLEPTDTQDACETQLVDRLLEHWGRWQRANGVRLQPTCAGQVLGINSASQRAWDLSITDDQFTFLDRCIRQLPGRLFGIVFLEYIETCSQGDKWRKSGLLRTAYRQRLHAAQWALVTLLGPFLDDCRHLSVNTAQTCS
jgi:hypothetical protein